MTDNIVIDYKIHKDMMALAIKDNTLNVLLIAIPAFTAFGLAIGMYIMNYRLETKANQLELLREELVQERVQLHKDYMHTRKTR